MTAIHYRIMAASLIIFLICACLIYKVNPIQVSHIKSYTTKSSEVIDAIENSNSTFTDGKIEISKTAKNDLTADGVNTLIDVETKDISAMSIQKSQRDASFFEKSDYATYDDQTLANLISMGDAGAMQIMATRLYARGGDNNLAQAKDLLERAIIKGDSYYPIQFLAEQKSILVLSAIKQGLEIDESSKRASLIDTFAYYELGAVMGDDTLKQSMTQLYAEQYNLRPSPQDWEEIRKKSIILQQELESKRQFLGL